MHADPAHSLKVDCLGELGQHVNPHVNPGITGLPRAMLYYMLRRGASKGGYLS